VCLCDLGTSYKRPRFNGVVEPWEKIIQSVLHIILCKTHVSYIAGIWTASSRSHDFQRHSLNCIFALCSYTSIRYIANCQFCPPVTLPLVKNTLNSTQPVWTLWRRGKSLAAPGIETRFLGHPARSVVTMLNNSNRMKVSAPSSHPYFRATRDEEFITRVYRVTKLHFIFNVCHPEVFNTYINIQWCFNQTQQNLVMLIVVLGQNVSILRRDLRWFYKNRNMLP